MSEAASASGVYEDDLIKRGGARLHVQAADECEPELLDGTDPEKVIKLLRKAETVLAGRTDRILLVLERCIVTHNYLCCLRTAECMGQFCLMHMVC